MKKVNLNLMSETKIFLSDIQISNFIKILQKISSFENKLKNSGIEINTNIFLFSMIEKEGLDSSVIEGSQTKQEDIYLDISEGINDVYSWEIRNLINLYKNSFNGFKNETIDFTVVDVRLLHKDLYTKRIQGYVNNFDSEIFINKIKPGKIITDDSKPNWIGMKNTESELQLIKPSKKMEYLEDLLSELRNSKNIKGLKSIKTLIKFHPFFEAIHPFSDGNGRIGRLLLVNLFQYIGFSSINWIFISDYWKDNKTEYIKHLNYVVTENKWNNWTSLFIKTLNETIDKNIIKLNKIIEIYEKYLKIFTKFGEKIILKHYLKYPILNKSKMFDELKIKYKVPIATIYRTWKNVNEKIGIIEKDGNFHFIELLEIIKN